MAKYVEENTRADRKHNIAVAIGEIRTANPTHKGVSTHRLRAHIRSALRMPVLTGEAHLGDLRAHGDAIGGHGLGLEVVRTKQNKKSVRAVMFNDENMKKVTDYLDGNGSGDILM